MPLFSAKSTGSSSALKLVWRRRIGPSRRGGPSIKFSAQCRTSAIALPGRYPACAAWEWWIWHRGKRSHVGNQAMFVAPAPGGVPDRPSLAMPRRFQGPAHSRACASSKVSCASCRSGLFQAARRKDVATGGFAALSRPAQRFQSAPGAAASKMRNGLRQSAASSVGRNAVEVDRHPPGRDQ